MLSHDEAVYKKSAFKPNGDSHTLMVGSNNWADVDLRFFFFPDQFFSSKVKNEHFS